MEPSPVKPSRYVLNRRQKLALAVSILFTIIILTVDLPITYGWYQPCINNLRTVKCQVTACTYVKTDKTDYQGITLDQYNVTVKYQYTPLKLSDSYSVITPAPLEYCKYTRPINSTLDCSYDARDTSTFSYDCHYITYFAVVFCVTFPLGAAILILLFAVYLIHRQSKAPPPTI